MSTPASCLLSRLQSAYRRAGQPPLHYWGYWPGTRSEASAIQDLVAAGLLIEHRGAWTLTEKGCGRSPGWRPEIGWRRRSRRILELPWLKGAWRLAKVPLR